MLRIDLVSGYIHCTMNIDSQDNVLYGIGSCYHWYNAIYVLDNQVGFMWKHYWYISTLPETSRMSSMLSVTGLRYAEIRLICQ